MVAECECGTGCFWCGMKGWVYLFHTKDHGVVKGARRLWRLRGKSIGGVIFVPKPEK